MNAPRTSLPVCPVCQQADRVQTLQQAHEEGTVAIAPPPLPESHASLLIYLSSGGILVGIAFFLSITILATSFFSWVQMSLILACLATAVLLAFLGIRHISQGDEAVRHQYPLWDQAMAHWTRLRFCARDQVVFDQETDQVLSLATVKALLDLDQIAAQGGSLPARTTIQEEATAHLSSR